MVGFPLRIGSALDSARLWVFYRIHPGHRYNRVDLRLQPGYYENDTRMLHAMFAILCDHLEEEGLENIEELIDILEQEVASGECSVSADATIRQIASMREKLALHDWWTRERVEDRKLRKELCQALYDVKPFKPVPDPENKEQFLTKKPLMARLRRMDDDMLEKEQEMCHRLVAIRRHLWTCAQDSMLVHRRPFIYDTFP